MNSHSLPDCRTRGARTLLQTLAFAALWWLGTLLAPAWAAPIFSGCTNTQFTLSPSPSGLINIPQTVGAVLYQGTVSATFTCNVTANVPQGFNIGSNIGSDTRVNGSGNTLWLIQDNSAGGQSFTTSPNCSMTVGVNQQATTQTYFIINVSGSNAGKTCTMTYAYKVVIKVRTVPTINRVAFPPEFSPTGSCTYRAPALCRWVIFDDGNKYDFTSATGMPTAVFANLGCTASVANTTVNLVATDVSAMAHANDVAGEQAFNITLNGCNAQTPNYVANSTWTYTPDAFATGMITNSASSAAGNVGIQLLDDTSTPIANNDVVPIATVTASGSYTKAFRARYLSKGSPTPGNVTGVAQFTLTYQ